MTAVTLATEARLSASISTSSSMKFSAVGAQVDWMTKTSWRRTFSSISTCTSPSENLPTSALPSGMPSCRHTACANGRLALPVKTSRFCLLISVTPRWRGAGDPDGRKSGCGGHNWQGR